MLLIHVYTHALTYTKLCMYVDWVMRQVVDEVMVKYRAIVNSVYFLNYIIAIGHILCFCIGLVTLFSLLLFEENDVLLLCIRRTVSPSVCSSLLSSTLVWTNKATFDTTDTSLKTGKLPSVWHNTVLDGTLVYISALPARKRFWHSIVHNCIYVLNICILFAIIIVGVSFETN